MKPFSKIKMVIKMRKKNTKPSYYIPFMKEILTMKNSCPRITPQIFAHSHFHYNLQRQDKIHFITAVQMYNSLNIKQNTALHTV